LSGLYHAAGQINIQYVHIETSLHAFIINTEGKSAPCIQHASNH